MKLTKEQQSIRDSFNEKVNTGIYTLESNPCICEGNDDVIVADTDRYGISITTKLCKNCGLVRTDPYYNPKTLKSFYENEYRGLYTNSEKPTQDFFSDEVLMGNAVLKNVKSFIPKLNLKSSVIYEIGCGGGGIIYPFHIEGAKVYGCDLGDEYLEIGKSKGMTLVNGDIEVLEQFGKADLIIMHHVVEHFLNPVERLSKAISLLKPNGYLYIAVPGLKVHPQVYGSFINYLQNAHVYSYTEITLSNLMAELGMEKVYGNERVVGIYKRGTNLVKRIENISKIEKLLKSSFRYKNLYNTYSVINKTARKLVSKIKRKI